MNTHSALLVIDAQVNMFAEGSSVFNGEQLLHTSARLIADARTARVPIIYVQHNGCKGDVDEPGTPGWQIHPSLAPAPGDVIVQKETPDAFHETTLQTELESRQIKNLIIVGMQTEMCIEATCRRANALGYHVTLVEDAHSTFDDAGLTAAQIIARTNDSLREIVDVVEAHKITSQ